MMFVVLPTYKPPTEGQLRNNIPLCVVFVKKSRIFISKDDKMVYNYFLGKLNVLLDHRFPGPI